MLPVVSRFAIGMPDFCQVLAGSHKMGRLDTQLIGLAMPNWHHHHNNLYHSNGRTLRLSTPWKEVLLFRDRSDTERRRPGTSSAGSHSHCHRHQHHRAHWHPHLHHSKHHYDDCWKRLVSGSSICLCNFNLETLSSSTQTCYTPRLRQTIVIMIVIVIGWGKPSWSHLFHQS